MVKYMILMELNLDLFHLVTVLDHHFGYFKILSQNKQLCSFDKSHLKHGDQFLKIICFLHKNNWDVNKKIFKMLIY